MEKELSIKTSDNNTIYGVLNEPNNKSDKLVIFVHGFTGHKNEHIFFNGAKFLKNNNIASFRFDLYSWQKGARTFTDCDIQTHVDDLTSVFNYFKSKYKKIYLVGHSLGGIVVLRSKLNANGIILWDPSHVSSFLEDNDYSYCKELDSYLLNWGIVYVVGKKMHDDKLQNIPPKELMDKIKCPIKIICAQNGVLIEGGQDYFSLANEPKEFALINGASHCFDEEGTEDKLFSETVDFINKY
jgi:pimeloyl-ACP methyl ester carboxylesterase